MLDKTILFLFLLVLSAGYAHALEVHEKSYPSINGVQLFVMDQSYARNPEAFFKELKGKGVDTVFLRVFHNDGDRPHLGLPNSCLQGGVYFNSKTACTVYDLLPIAAKYAHQNDIKIYAWMATRSLSFLKTPENVTLSFMPDNLSTGYGANIFKPDVRGSLQKLFMELAANDIDGILIQDDFILKYNEGADVLSCREFTKATGIACTRDDFFTVTISADGKKKFGPRGAQYEAWINWKSDELIKLFSSIRHSARLVNPGMKWAVNIYYETPVFPDKGLAWYAQDMDKILAAGADYLAVMAYHEQIASEMKMNRNETLNFMESLGNAALASTSTPSRAIFKLQIRRFDANRTPIRDTEIKLVHNRLRKAGGVSFVELPVNNASEVIIYK